jgi:hypothetical protein
MARQIGNILSFSLVKNRFLFLSMSNDLLMVDRWSAVRLLHGSDWQTGLHARLLVGFSVLVAVASAGK